jgi:hypothetical protein
MYGGSSGDTWAHPDKCLKYFENLNFFIRI